MMMKIFSKYNRPLTGFARASNPAFNAKPYYKQFGGLDSCQSICDVKPEEVMSIEDQVKIMVSMPDPQPDNDLEYGDFSQPRSFVDLMNDANAFVDEFEKLSKKQQAYFDNDPEIFASVLDNAATDNKLRQDLLDLGIVQDKNASPQRSSTGEATQTQTAGAQPVGEPAPDPAKAAAEKLRKAAEGGSGA